MVCIVLAVVITLAGLGVKEIDMNKEEKEVEEGIDRDYEQQR